MKKLILFSFLVAALVGAARTWAEVDPGDRYLDAYLLVQEGDAAEHQSNWVTANAKYTTALDILHEISTTSSNWNPNIVEFRTKYCTEHLNALKNKPSAPPQAVQAPAPTPTPAVTPAPVPTRAPVVPVSIAAPPIAATPVVAKPAPVEAVVTPPAETERIQRLAAELQSAQNKVRELETARADLKTKLDEALTKPAPVTPVPTPTPVPVAKVPVPVVAAPDTHIADLTKQSQELSAQLGAAQAQIADLKGKLQVAAKPLAPVAPASPVESPELNQLRTELQGAQDKIRELEAARTDLKSKLDEALAKPAAVAPVPTPTPAPAPDTRVADLTKQNQELNIKLALTQIQVANLKDKLQATAKPAPPVVPVAPDTHVADLTKQNQELSTQLATTQAQMADLKEKLKAAVNPVVPVVSAPVVSPAPAELNQLRAELKSAQEKARQLEAAQTELTAKLQQAQAKPAPVVPVTRIAELTKRNQELDTQLSVAQTQAADLKEKLRVAMKPAVPVESPELKHLRVELQHAKDELIASRKNLDDMLKEKSTLDQRYQNASARLSEAERKLRAAKPGTERDELIVVKKQLEQSQRRLTVAQEAVEAARAEAMRHQRTAAEAAAKLIETSRQLRAVKTASAKNEEIIQQLRQDNANLKREQGQNFNARHAEEEYTGPTIPELKGWRPHNWPLKKATPKSVITVTPATAASKQQEVTATIPAPPKPGPAKSEPVKPAPAQDSDWWPFGKKAPSAVTNQPPAKVPVKGATN